MKKNAPINPGQKKLTHFFSKKPPGGSQSNEKTNEIDEQVKISSLNQPKSDCQGKQCSSELKDSEVCSNYSEDLFLDTSLVKNGSPTKELPADSSPRKLTQKSIYEYSPSKDNFEKKYESSQTKTVKSTLFKSPLKKSSPWKKNVRSPFKKTSPKKTQVKSPQKASLRNLFGSKIKNGINILKEDANISDGAIKNDEGCDSTDNFSDISSFTSKKRKFDSCPLKEKQNELDSVPNTSPENIRPHVDQQIPDNDSSIWSGDADFVNLCVDSIIISPKKIQVKKRKCGETEELKAKSSLDFDKPLNKENFKNFLEKDLSSYFVKEFTIDEKSEISFEKLKRYEIIDISRSSEEVKVSVKNPNDDVKGVCIIRSPWDEFPLSPKDIVSIRATKKDDKWIVDWNGLLVINPDRLISGTTIVGSVYCMRKTVLSHIFKESGGAKDCMVVGSFVHELFQEALKEKLRTVEQIEKVYKNLITNKDFMLNLFYGNMDFEGTVAKMQSYIPHIYKFMQQYAFSQPQQMTSQNWSGEVTKVEDIEENIWSPVLGVKGKVDATVEVKVNRKTKVMPLELKTGKVSFSIEHRGQVILYCMLLQQLGRNVDSGLLLYLNSGVDMKEIKCEERETRDLTLLRNGLSHWLLKMSMVEPTESIKPPTLPPPINRRTCSSCPFLVPCSAALSKEEFAKLGENHRMKEFAPDAIKHLSEDHINFVFHWLGLLLLEKNSSTSSMSFIWSVDPEIREKSGKCLAQMKINQCKKDSNGGYIAEFLKLDGSLLETEFTVGQLIVVSTEGHFAHSLGVIQTMSPMSITLLLDKFFKSEKPIFLDAYEGDSTTTILTNSLSCLLENNTHAALLRELIIDLKVPTFSTKLSSKIKKIGVDIFERLNREQVRAVLQAIAAENYILIKGMPGTGKTTTMAALIELLTRMKKKVLVTSFTHSAIDNILINLVGKVKILRLGPDHRIHPKIKEVSENHLVKSLKDVTPATLEELFSSREVVGVTCFGSKHPWIERQRFDVCLIDEATQVPLPGILKPISVCNKFILVGDPKQLPPLVLNKTAKELGLGKSLFERLERPAVTSPLTIQYRMNRVINSLANDVVFGGQLQCANEAVGNATLELPKALMTSCPLWLKEALSTDISKSVMILDVICNAVNDSGENKTEAAVVQQIADVLVKCGVSLESIGVIATYSKQVNLLKSQIPKLVEVNTVDQYQGRDKDIIIYSTTRTSASVDRNDILSDWNRLTVGITRAKRKLIIIGNVSVLNQYDNFKKLISAVSDDNIIPVVLSEV